MKSRIQAIARELGFDDCRFAAAQEAPHAGAFREWIADGCHGEMAWMEKTPHRRCDPREVLAGCRTVICLGLNYYPGRTPFADGRQRYRFARYAWSEDYHDIITKQLKAFDAELMKLGGTQRYYVDTGPVLERDFASLSGLGWNGKSTVQIHRNFGSWLFLADILTTLEIAPDSPFGDHCGKCTRCVTACPTGAITQPHRVDARRCISYLTIENKGAIPEEFRPLIGDRIYGCDECLEVCPWNKFAQVSREARFHARESIFRHELRDFLAFDDETFRTVFAKSPVKRIKLPRFLRNVCVALGNVGTAEELPALRKAAQHEDPLVAEHAQWAVENIERREAKTQKPAR